MLDRDAVIRASSGRVGAGEWADWREALAPLVGGIEDAVLFELDARLFAVAVAVPGGGAVVVRASAERLLELRIRSGAGRLIQEIGANQGVQFPIARAYTQVEAAGLMVEKAAKMFDAGLPCGAEANMAKMLASEASWNAGDVCMQTHGGFAFAKEYHIERKFRETRLYQIAPISTNLILSYVAEHVLEMPRSY